MKNGCNLVKEWHTQIFSIIDSQIGCCHHFEVLYCNYNGEIQPKWYLVITFEWGSYWHKINASELHFAWSFQGWYPTLAIFGLPKYASQILHSAFLGLFWTNDQVMFLCWRCMVAMVSDCAGFVWRMSSYDAIGRIFLTQGCCFELWTTQGGSMRAHDGTLAFLTIFAWLVGCGLSGPPTPPPESPLSLPEKIFNKIGENAKLIMVLLKYQKFWDQQIILSTQMLFLS